MLRWHSFCKSEESYYVFLDFLRFDVAGAGACLKRYTDPSFFRVDASVGEVQRERKVRRVKVCD